MSDPAQCIGQNYARNEASFFLARLLQEFDTFTLATDVQPRESLPPAHWKNGPGRQAVEQIWPAYAMTLFAKVRVPAPCLSAPRTVLTLVCFLGRPVGPLGQGAGRSMMKVQLGNLLA